MVEGQAHHHRSTLKQQNKKFKSKYATKKSLRTAAKGRIARQSSKTPLSLTSAAQLRSNRRNTAKQTQANKRFSLASATRIFSGADGAPRIVAVIPLTHDVCARSVVTSLAESLQIAADDCPNVGIWRMKAERFRTSLQFINLPYKNFYAALDACKIADYVVFVLSTTVEVEPWGDTLLRTLQAQGLPDVISVVPQDSLMDAKNRSAVLKSLLSFMQYFVPNQSRIFDLHVSADRLNALRALAEGKPSNVRWREGRTWILGESVSWQDGVLKVTGTVRGSGLSANRLLHLQNHGDFQVHKIESAPLPRLSKSGVTTELDSVVLAEPEPSEVDSLVSTNDPDDLANEQTWPTEEEMNENYEKLEQASFPDAAKGTTPRIKRVPKGTSDYQAAWIIDESDEEDDDVDVSGGEEQVNASDDNAEEEMEDLVMEDKDMAIEDPKNVGFEDLDVDEEEKQLKSWRDRRREEEDDLAFPDEIDTPRDQPARLRFQRYRGLRSFRTSPWDPYENLPRDYGRIFQFEDFRKTERKIRKRAEADAKVVEPGTRVSVYLKDVNQEASISAPVILFGLLQHEHKTTVLNFTFQRNTEYDESVRSKDPLVLCVGPHRMRVNPIYSQLMHGGGRGSNNANKFERYFRHGVTNVATMYGPMTFGKQPCILLRETADMQVAMGSFLNPDATRIIAKRIILTGHPVKVHKRSATIRYMFFNQEDVNYFKPIQLYTKYGRTGHIRESLGTHGYFKAHFDGPLNQMDTVCMNLYKRVYPKWSQMWKIDNELDSAGDAMEE